MSGAIQEPELMCLRMHSGPCKELLGGNTSRQCSSITVTDSHLCASTGAQGRQRQPWRHGKCWSAPCVPLLEQPRVTPGTTAPTWALVQCGGNTQHPPPNTRVHTRMCMHIHTRTYTLTLLLRFPFHNPTPQQNLTLYHVSDDQE